jgi:putative sigma-54 modulation protein
MIWLEKGIAMQLSHTFRNLDASDALKDYAREKLERINKYFPDPIKAHVVYSQQRGYLSVVDVQITLHNGLVVKGVESTEDFHSSVDLVMAKIERQLRRYKDRIRDHKPQQGPERSMLHRVVAMEPDKETRAAAPTNGSQAAAAPPAAVPASSATPPGSRVIKEEKFIAKPMSVDEAIMRMNLLHENIVCFHNIATHEINVIYRREDHTYGLIETTHGEAPEPVRDQATDKITGMASGAHGNG